MKPDLIATADEADLLLDSYHFELPETQIAQHPAERRDASRLMILDRTLGTTISAHFADLPDILAERMPSGALLVANDSRVAPARVMGARDTGGRVEMLLLTPPPLLRSSPGDAPGWATARAEVLLRASKTLKIGEAITFGEDLAARIATKGEFGRHEVELSWRGELASVLERRGAIPLPPYIRRNPGAEDATRYQTIYADPQKTGSVAAPTAGLHFTPEIRARLAERGFEFAFVTLYVGYGTFSPVRAKDLREHRMHAEYIEISEQTAGMIRTAKMEGRPVLAVGTTSARTLEGAFQASGEIRAFAGSTDIFITPGYRFEVVDHMLTNFHLPLSSLIIMISGFAGRARVLSAYDQAVREGYRFFSYGDAMLIL